MQHTVLLRMCLVFCALLGGFGARDARAADQWSFELDATANSKYVWRGINLVDAPVFQPSVTAAHGGWSFNVWGNMETINANSYGSHGQANNKFTEIDLTLEYAWEHEDWNFALGVIHYIFPNTGFNNTTEIYGSVGYDCLLEPTITVYQDIDQSHGTYITFGLSHTFEEVWKPTENTSMDIEIGGTVGWGSSSNNAFYYGAGNSGLTDLTTSVGFPINLGKGWTLKPAINYSTLLDHNIQSNQSPDTNVWFGLSLTYSF